MSSFAGDEWVWLDRRSSIACLDVALVYLRRELGRLAPLYLIAVLPLAAVMLMAIDAISTQRRSLAVVLAAALTLATVWRWIFLAVIQRRVQADLRGQHPLPVRRRLGAIVLGRLIANTAMTWGSVLIVPGLWGFFASAFVSPAVLEGEGSVRKRLAQAITLGSSNRLMRILVALTIGFLLLLLSVIALNIMLVNDVLGSAMGIDTADLTITFQSLSWSITVMMLMFLLFDFYWTVASVFVFYDQQSRPLGTDLRLRLAAFREASA